MSTTPVSQVPEKIQTLAYGYFRGDTTKMMAVLMHLYEKQPSRLVEEKTGIPESTIRRLAEGFRKVCRSMTDRGDFHNQPTTHR